VPEEGYGKVWSGNARNPCPTKVHDYMERLCQKCETAAGERRYFTKYLHSKPLHHPARRVPLLSMWRATASPARPTPSPFPSQVARPKVARFGAATFWSPS